MNDHSVSELFMIDGPNGAGKSTVAELLLSAQSIGSYVNADVIAKGMAAEGLVASEISAGRVLLDVVQTALTRGVSVAFETTMLAPWEPGTFSLTA